MIGWDPYVGSIERDKAADLLIVEGTQGDPCAGLIAADESKIIAVVSRRATLKRPAAS